MHDLAQLDFWQNFPAQPLFSGGLGAVSGLVYQQSIVLLERTIGLAIQGLGKLMPMQEMGCFLVILGLLLSN